MGAIPARELRLIEDEHVNVTIGATAHCEVPAQVCIGLTLKVHPHGVHGVITRVYHPAASKNGLDARPCAIWAETPSQQQPNRNQLMHSSHLQLLTSCQPPLTTNRPA